MLRTAAPVLIALGMIVPATGRADTPDATQNLAQNLSQDRAQDRAKALVERMTREEKLAMVEGRLGRALRKDTPRETRIGAGYVPGVPRLGIPALYETDASLGVANSMDQRPGDVATAMPSTLATAASFDPAIAFAGGRMIGAEARAKGFNVLLAGGANLIRDPWAGRDFEYFSEDVLLTGTMAGAAIAGVQSNHIVSTVKHLALNAQETGRTVMDARLDDRALRTSDLLAFELAIERGHPGSAMCSYNKLNGDYTCENAYLLNRVLKHDWGFPGWVMSDWGATHSTVKAALAGLDQQSGFELDKAPYFGAPLKAALDDGAVPEARLDDMVTRIVHAMAATGLLDDPAPDAPQPIDYAAHATVARQAEEAGIVLLRNQGGLLPLAASAKRILVVGGLADRGVPIGGGSSGVKPVGGLSAVLPIPGGGPLSAFLKVMYGASSPLAAIQARAPQAQVTFLDGSDPAAVREAAAKADVVLVFAEQWRSEAIDLDSLSLSADQDAAITAAADANRHTVVVRETGGAVAMPWIGKVGAVIEAWYPGQRGGEAIARVLFGDVGPSGRLPVTFPATSAQAPRQSPVGADIAAHALAEARARGVTDPFGLIKSTPPFEADYREGADVGYRWYARTGAPTLFPFGFGLSYTRFALRDLKIRDGAAPSVSFTVTNTGARAGAAVPQVYAAVSLGDGPTLPRLVGFAKVQLAPHERRRITIPLETRLFADFDPATGGWAFPKGAVPITVAQDAAARGLAGRVTVR